MKDSGRQKDRQRWERKEWPSLVKKHPRHVKASPWGLLLLMKIIIITLSCFHYQNTDIVIAIFQIDLPDCADEKRTKINY